MLLLVVYVNDIIVIGDDTWGLKCYLQKYFQTKELEFFRYFLGEVARSRRESQRKYVLDMLSEARMLGCRATDASMKANAKLQPDQGEILDHPGKYHQL